MKGVVVVLRSRHLAIVTAVLLVAVVVLASAVIAGVTASRTKVTTASPAARASQVSPSSTVVARISPLNGQGHLKARYTVVSSARGYCWTTSFMNGRLFRCFRGNTIMDPCWKETGRHSVVCLATPWSTNVHRLRLTRRLPATSADGPRLWGLRLGGGVGVNCLMSTGAVGTVGKHPITYLCRHGWVLLGGPDRSRPLWTILTAKGAGAHYDLRGRKPLPTAWRAVR